MGGIPLEVYLRAEQARQMLAVKWLLCKLMELEGINQDVQGYAGIRLQLCGSQCGRLA